MCGYYKYASNIDIDTRVLHIQGWMSHGELQWLHQQAKAMPSGATIIEIGAWKGRSSAALYQGAGKLKSVVSIDTWLGTPTEMHAHAEALEVDMFEVYLSNMRELGYDVQPYSTRQLGPQCIKGDSVVSAELFDNHSVDMVFIDGDHSQCGADIDAWLPKVKAGGILCGHDYFCFYESIQQEIHKRFWINRIVESIWVKQL